MNEQNGDETPRDRVLFLARARSRGRILERLSESGASTQRELRSDLDVARTTVSRSLRSLAEKGWVEKSDDGYLLTHAGRLIAAAYSQMLETVENVDELAEFLRRFPTDIESPDLLDATDVGVTYSTDAAPYAPARKQTEILHTAERLRILLPAIDLESTRTIADQVTQRGLEVETVVSPGVESTMESEAFAPMMREKVRTGLSSVFVAGESVPFYLGLADDGRTQIGLADENGLPISLLETTDESIREWAERTYQRYREPAREKPAGEF